MFGRTVKGIIEGDSITDEFIPKLVELYAQGLFPIDQLVTYYPFTEINRAVEDLENGIVIKAILVP
jgi:aryl-alcohol dehydrogenase